MAQAVIAQVNKPDADFAVPLPLPEFVAAPLGEPSPDPALAGTSSETAPETAQADADPRLEAAPQLLANNDAERNEEEREVAQQEQARLALERAAQGAAQHLEQQRRLDEGQRRAREQERILAQQEAQQKAQEQERLLAEQRLAEQRRAQQQALAEERERYEQQRLQEQERLLAQQRLDEERLSAQRQEEELRMQEQERLLAQQRLERERRAHELAVQERRQAEALGQREFEELAARQEAQRLALRQREEERRLAEALRQRELAEPAARQEAQRLALQQREAERQAEELARREAEQLRRREAEELALRQAEQQERMQAQESARGAAQQALAQRPADSTATAAGRGGAAAGNAAGPGNSDGGALPKSVLGSDVANRARELLRGITVPGAPPPVVQPAEHARQARRALVDGAQRDVPLRLYIDSVRQKIERNAALGSVRGASLGVRIEPLVSIVLRSDGSVDDVTIVRSSGRADIDEAVRQIVRLNERYSAFPPNVAARYDVIEFRRIWAFAEGLKLREEVR